MFLLTFWSHCILISFVPQIYIWKKIQTYEKVVRIAQFHEYLYTYKYTYLFHINIWNRNMIWKSNIHLNLTVVNVLSYLNYLISFCIILVEPFESKLHASDILPLKTFTSHYLKVIASRLLQWTKYMYLYLLNCEFILLPLILIQFYRVLSLLPSFHNYIFLLPQWEPWFSRTSILWFICSVLKHAQNSFGIVTRISPQKTSYLK